MSEFIKTGRCKRKMPEFCGDGVWLHSQISSPGGRGYPLPMPHSHIPLVASNQAFCFRPCIPPQFQPGLRLWFNNVPYALYHTDGGHLSPCHTYAVFAQPVLSCLTCFWFPKRERLGTSWMFLLWSSQQCQSTEGNSKHGRQPGKVTRWT